MRKLINMFFPKFNVEKNKLANLKNNTLNFNKPFLVSNKNIKKRLVKPFNINVTTKFNENPKKTMDFQIKPTKKSNKITNLVNKIQLLTTNEIKKNMISSITKRIPVVKFNNLFEIKKNTVNIKYDTVENNKNNIENDDNETQIVKEFDFSDFFN